jgi:hypothetical protein
VESKITIVDLSGGKWGWRAEGVDLGYPCSLEG